MSGWPRLRGRRDWRGVLRPGRFVAVRAVLWAVAVFALMLGTAFGLGHGARFLHLPHEGAGAMVPLALVLALSLAIYAGAVRWGERRAVTELALGRLVPEVGFGLLFGTLMFTVVMGVLLLGGWYQISAGPPGPPWKGITIGLSAGVLEELLFRGVLMRLLWEAFGLPVALAVSSAVFGLAHLVNPLHSVMGAVSIVVEAGIMLGALFALTGRLWASIGAHAGWNFTQGYVFGADVSGTNPGGHWLQAVQTDGAPVLFTGGAFGPEASLPAVLIGAAAGVAVLALAWRRGMRGGVAS